MTKIALLFLLTISFQIYAKDYSDYIKLDCEIKKARKCVGNVDWNCVEGQVVNCETKDHFFKNPADAEEFAKKLEKGIEVQ